jgi:hypothetical protein
MSCVIAAQTEVGGRDRKCVGEFSGGINELFGDSKKRRLSASERGGGVDGLSLEVVSDE